MRYILSLLVLVGAFMVMPETTFENGGSPEPQTDTAEGPEAPVAPPDASDGTEVAQLDPFLPPARVAFDEELGTAGPDPLPDLAALALPEPERRMMWVEPVETLDAWSAFALANDAAPENAPAERAMFEVVVSAPETAPKPTPKPDAPEIVTASVEQGFAAPETAPMPAAKPVAERSPEPPVEELVTASVEVTVDEAPLVALRDVAPAAPMPTVEGWSALAAGPVVMAAMQDTAPDAPTLSVLAVALNMRSGPSSKTAVVGVLRSGDVAYDTGERKGSWVKVRTDGDSEGWVFAKYLSGTSGS